MYTRTRQAELILVTALGVQLMITQWMLLSSRVVVMLTLSRNRSQCDLRFTMDGQPQDVVAKLTERL